MTQALREVFDPELGMSIVELGMVYGIDVRGGAVTVTMTLTAPGCPVHDVMPQWVKEAVAKIPGVERVDVTITFDPPWTPDRIARMSRARRDGRASLDAAGAGRREPCWCESG